MQPDQYSCWAPYPSPSNADQPSSRCCPRLLQGGTLVVCPTTVLHQWASEIKTKVNPNAGINVHVYHGKGERLGERSLCAQTAGCRCMAIAVWLRRPASCVACLLSRRACNHPSPRCRLPSAGKGLSAQTLSRYGVVLTTYATMALEAPRREGAGAGGGKKAGKKPVPPGMAAGDAAGAAGSAWGDDDSVVDLLSDSEEAGPSSAQQPAAKRQKGAGGKKAAAGGGRSKEGGPLHQIYWHRWVWGCAGDADKSAVRHRPACCAAQAS